MQTKVGMRKPRIAAQPLSKRLKILASVTIAILSVYLGGIQGVAASHEKCAQLKTEFSKKSWMC
jgi:hypothetical protein